MNIIHKLFIIILILTSSCQDDFDTAPGLYVYKTKGDYFYNYSSWRLNDNSFWHTPFQNIRINGGDTVYLYRVRLLNGYILPGEVSLEQVFFDLTFADVLEFHLENPGMYMPDSMLNDNILDEDPFLDLYYDANRPRKYEYEDTALINQMIRDNELDKYFERLK